MKTVALSVAKVQPLAPEHLAAVLRCLKLLQQAQTLCDLAAQALCPVPGFAEEWNQLGNGREAVKREWYQVHDRLQTMRTRAVAGRCPACNGRLLDVATCQRCGFILPPHPLELTRRSSNRAISGGRREVKRVGRRLVAALFTAS